MLTGCRGPASTLAPAGPAAQDILSLFWVLSAIAAAVYLLVLGALAIAIRRRRSSSARGGWATAVVVAGGIVLPLLVLPALLFPSVRALAALTRGQPAHLVVEIVGQRYWWELRYRNLDGTEMVTANELHVPQGRRVELRLRATDVIHSFWVPALQGKLDLVPGKTNVTWVQGDRVGTFPGQCAEYCGIQHALMRLLVVVQPPGEFDAWLEAQRGPARPPGDVDRAQQVFLTHCARCHVVRGTSASFGHIGPDLTHLMSRRTIAAGTLANARGDLASWIADPQAQKPGNLMPRIVLPPEDLHAVVDYLASLR